MKPNMPGFPCIYGATNGADGISARLLVASAIAEHLASKLLPPGVTQNMTNRSIQAKQIALDAIDIAERLIELDAERELAEQKQ